MKIDVEVLCILLALFFNKSTFAVDLTLYTNETDIRYWPRLIYDGLSINLCRGELEFEFKTFLKTAVVLYQDDGGGWDYVAINLQNGHLHLKASFGMVVVYTTSNNTYNDFKWHSVGIRLKCPQPCVEMTVDKKVTVYVRDSWSEETSCKLTKNLQIGGFSGARLKARSSISYESFKSMYNFRGDKERRGFFNACVRNVRYGETKETMKDITNDFIEKANVSKGCHLNYCHKPDPICKNLGKCSPVEKTTSVTCNCEWTGFTGQTCTKDALYLIFNGSYRVQHVLSNKSPEREKYAFRIKTSQKNALLFYARGPKNYKDFMQIEIDYSRIKLKVNFGEDEYTITSKVNITDSRWHYVEYRKNDASSTLLVDAISEKRPIGKWREMDYHEYSFLGEVTEVPYNDVIRIQDFIWITEGKDKLNFVTGLYDTFKTHGHNAGFRVIPEYVLPKFNEPLPNFTPKPLPYTHPNVIFRSTSKASTSQQKTSTPADSGPLALGKNDDEGDSSLTWIIVVTVILSVLVLAAVGFFVRKWNQRYSGDFQVNRQPTGPAETIVHYQDAAHKDKQRQMRL